MTRTTKADGAAAVLDKVAEWPSEMRALGEALHSTIVEAVPELKPKLWYGMPGYATTGPVLCFFRNDDGFFSFGLTEKAHFAIADGAPDQLIPTAWTLTSIDDPTRERITDILRTAVG